MNRQWRIKEQLNLLVALGILTDWQKSAPDGVRWTLTRERAMSITLTTREVEAWLSGAFTAWDVSGQQMALAAAKAKAETLAQAKDEAAERNARMFGTDPSWYGR